ncbi:Coenzyme PQQ synthesis protein E [Halioglobus japonicus]|nr:Coenzyme PQQ synthesis protein E [Halioglobus japonicus]
MGSSFKKRNLSAYENFLRAKYEMFSEKVHVSTLPYYLCLDPADKCQLRCPTCPTGIENESKFSKDGPPTIYREDRQKLSVELCDSLLDELGDNLFMVMFYNYGEPLLNTHLHEFVRKANDRDIATELHSNLSLPLSDQRIDELLSAGLGTLAASVDGFSQEAYEIHRVGGKVELVHENLERLAKARDRLGLDTEIIYNYLVFKHNEHEIEAARRFAKDIGISFSTRDALIQDPSWLPSHRKDEQPYYSQEHMDEMTKVWEEAGRGDYFFEHESQYVWSPIPKQFESVLPRTCGWHYGFSVVTAGGPVAPCCATTKDQEDMGTVVAGEVSFADIWNSDVYTKSRKAMIGESSDGLEHVDSTCTRCYFPKFVHHLYDTYDTRVVQQFGEVFGDSEPEMAKAFALLGDEIGGADAAGFVAHYEQNLLMGTAAKNTSVQIDRIHNALSHDEAMDILRQFGAVISSVGLNGNQVFDESLLRHSKDRVMASIMAILGAETAAEQQSFAREAALVLAFFQSDVGKDSAPIDTVRSNNVTWRNDVEAEIQKNNRLIAAQTEAV